MPALPVVQRAQKANVPAATLSAWCDQLLPAVATYAGTVKAQQVGSVGRRGPVLWFDLLSLALSSQMPTNAGWFSCKGEDHADLSVITGWLIAAFNINVLFLYPEP